MAFDDKNIAPVNAPAPPPPEFQETAMPEVAPEVPVETPAEPEQRMYAGKYKTPEELEAAYTEAQSVLGRQGNELGDTRRQAEMIAQQNATLLAQLQAMTPQEKAAVADDKAVYEDALAQVAQRVEDGEISVAEALQHTARLSAEFSARTAKTVVSSHFQEMEQQREAERLSNEFLAQHPDFSQLDRAGYLDAVTQKNPLLNKVSAYLTLKNMELGSKMEQAAQAAYLKGKEDVAKLAAGVKVTETVVSKPGAPVRQVNTPSKPMTREEFLRSAAQSVKAARGEG